MANRKSGWEETVYVYQQFYGLMRHIHAHGIFPIQVTREGSKNNKKSNGQLLTEDDMAQAHAVSHNADVIITLNRSIEDERAHRVQLHCTKSRQGEKRWTFVSQTNFAACYLFGIGLPAHIDGTGVKAVSDAMGQNITAMQPTNVIALVPKPPGFPVTPMLLDKEVVALENVLRSLKTPEYNEIQGEETVNLATMIEASAHEYDWYGDCEDM
jgi:hypothetical protein